MSTKPNKRGGDNESSEKGFRIVIVKMIQNLENKMELQINSLETRTENMREKFNQDLEEMKAKLKPKPLKDEQRAARIDKKETHHFHRESSFLHLPRVEGSSNVF